MNNKEYKSTDKISQHGYHRFYEPELGYLQNENFGMIEIGVQSEDSLNLWLDYFPKTYIYGIDIGMECTGDRYRVFKSDQNDIKQLSQIPFNDIRFINDDGSHIPEHQLKTFGYLFENVLQPGGVYIIEHIETSYWKTGGLYGNPTRYGIRHPESIIEKFKILVDVINRDFISFEDKLTLNLSTSFLSLNATLWIASITFAQNCIIVRKKNKIDFEYNNRPYAWSEFI
jgi:hypothetical protein